MNPVCPQNIQAVYAMNTRISTFDVDPDRLLTPSAQLRLQQEVGERHFGEGGMGFEGMAAAGLAFVTVQNNCVIYRRPAVNEQVTLETWNRGTRGVRFFRGYRFLSASGELLIDSTCSFALVDVHTHTLERPEAFERIAPLAAVPAPVRESTCPDPQRIRLPSSMTEAGRHTVRYSQLDFNGHLNNTCYADVMCDYAPLSPVGKAVKGFSVIYLHEAKQGDTLSLTAAMQQEEEGVRLFMQGDNGGKPCFTATMLFS